MVNPNIVIPNGFHLCEEESVNIKEEKDSLAEDTPPAKPITPDDNSAAKKIRAKFVTLKEKSFDEDLKSTASSPKPGVRVLKPALDSSVSSPATTFTSQPKTDTSRLRNATPASKNTNTKCGFYYQNETFYPKPAFSYSCLIAMALKNSKHGCLPVAEIYNFMW